MSRIGLIVSVLLLASAHALSADDRCVKDLTLIFQAKDRDLGNGYAIYHESYEAPPDHWEGKIHYDCLHHDADAIALIGPWSLSPSRGHLLFNDARAGAWGWVLADAAGHRATVGSVRSSFEFFDAIVWDESHDEVRVTYTNGSAPDTFKLRTLSNQASQPTPRAGAAER